MGRQVDLMPVRVHTYIHLTNDALTRTRRQVQPARPSIRPGAPVPPRMPAVGLDTEDLMKGALVDVKRCKVQTCQCHIRLMLHLCATCVAWHTHTTDTQHTQQRHNTNTTTHITIQSSHHHQSCTQPPPLLSSPRRSNPQQRRPPSCHTGERGRAHALHTPHP